MTTAEYLTAQELANLASKLDGIGRQILIAFGNGVLAGRQTSNKEAEKND